MLSIVTICCRGQWECEDICMVYEGSFVVAVDLACCHGDLWGPCGHGDQWPTYLVGAPYTVGTLHVLYVVVDGYPRHASPLRRLLKSMIVTTAIPIILYSAAIFKCEHDTDIKRLSSIVFCCPYKGSHGETCVLCTEWKQTLLTHYN